MIWGWEGFTYEYKLNYAYPSGIPSNAPTYQYDYAPAMGKTKLFTVNFFDNEVDVDWSDLKGAIKYLHNKAEQELASDAIKLREAKVAQFRVICPNKVQVAVSAYHESKPNKKSFSKIFFDSSAEISLNVMGAINGESIWKILGIKNTSAAFTIENIRVYGVAKYGSTYKGIGIKKEK